VPKIENRFLRSLKKPVIIGDGAMGTVLQEMGLPAGEAPEKWVLDFPEKVLKVHQDYIDAGSQLIETNTFGANRIKLKTMGLEDRIEEINSRAVELAREAAGENIVAGSIGPTGKMMLPYGELGIQEAEEAFAEQIRFQIEAGIDVVCIETMIDLQEMKAAVKAAKELGIPIIAQMTFSENQFTLVGNSPEETTRVLEGMGVDVIGVNCSLGSRQLIPIIKRMAGVTTKPLSVQPNAGMPELRKGLTIYPETPEFFASSVREFLDNNVWLIGACCGSDPDFIREIKHEVELYQDNNH
jgi:5-methyltetrahydrofolate--homocysteine methyltransferase